MKQLINYLILEKSIKIYIIKYKFLYPKKRTKS